MTTDTQLQDHCNHIAQLIANEDWTNGMTADDFDSADEYEEQNNALNWIADALDIEWVVSSNRKELLGARILVAYGGPNIWVDTRTGRVEGHWWGESAVAAYPQNNGAAELDDACEMLFAC